MTQDSSGDAPGAPRRPQAWSAPLRAAAALLALAALAGCGGGSSSGGSPAPAKTFAISGTASHVGAAGLTLTDGGETVAVAQGATTFAFTTPLADGSAYAVSVATQPAGETCAVTGGTGTVSGANVTAINVACSTLISSPMALGVQPSGGPASNGSRIFLPITAVGDNAVTINSVLDTGSSGLVLNAFLVFPSSLVTSTGFVFPAGQDTLTYNGITVTKAQFSRSYGGQTTDPTQDTGNLGFAQLTIGAGTTATTKVVPILFVWQHTSNGAPAAASDIPNFFGVNADLGPIMSVQGGTVDAAALQPCTLTSTTTCGVASPLRYLTYAAGVSAGYTLDRITLNACAIGTAGACPTQNALTLGLNAAVSSGFSTVALTCRAATGADFQGAQFCSQVIAGVAVASGGASFTGPAIFDSGVPMVRLTVPQGQTFPSSLPAGSIVQVTPPGGGGYSFTTGTGYLNTVVVQAASASDFSNLGIAFFTKDAFLLSYAAGIEGWK